MSDDQLGRAQANLQPMELDRWVVIEPLLSPELQRAQEADWTVVQSGQPVNRDQCDTAVQV